MNELSISLTKEEAEVILQMLITPRGFFYENLFTKFEHVLSVHKDKIEHPERYVSDMFTCNSCGGYFSTSFGSPYDESYSNWYCNNCHILHG